MAVKLVRAELESDTSSHISILPIIEIRNKEVKAPEYFNGRVSGRTSKVFTSDGHKRQVVWQTNFSRRQSQLTDGGFHGSPGHKYTEIGDVVLDDSTLILQALQQERKQPLKSQDTRNSTAELTIKGRRPPPLLRSRTPSQFPDQLKSLHLELHHSNAHLNKIRKGHGLFHLIKKETHKKLQNIDTKVKLEKEQNLLEWNQAAGSDSTHELTSSSEITEQQIDNDIEVQHVYRFLCVIQWILDCMKLDSPHYMPALGTYWRVTNPQIINGKRIYERQQTTLKRWEEITANETVLQNQPKKDIKKDSSSPVLKSERKRIEEEKIRKQRNLTPEQFEKLKVTVDEELNKSKKKAHMKIKELIQESALKHQRRHKSIERKTESPSIGLSIEQWKLLIGKVDESHRMITHEQLSVMSRDRQDALEQRFSSLTISGNIWRDISNMRSGVRIESTAMAHNKLMMNYDWISDLNKMLSDDVLSNQYCKKVIEQLCVQQEYMKSVGPTTMSQEKLIHVLSTLYPWQLDSPEVTKAIEFIIKHVIYVVPEDYQKWVEYNFNEK